MTRLFYTLIFLAFISAISAQDFYDINTIQTIEVTFDESNWDQLMDNAYASDAGYIMAQKVVVNGIEYDSVGVKYKGNSSYRSNQVKNPWHIELDTYKEQEYQGYTDIKLANGTKDPSMIRDVLAYQILRQYMEAPEANFANLYVNGELIGLYANTESVSKKFMNGRFGSKGNTRFKCSPPGGAGPQSNDFPNLVYMGQDSTDYYDSYEVQSDNGWQDLIDLCDTLSNHTEHIEDLLDVNKILWMLAFDNVVVNLDSYIGRFAQNYYLYKSDFGQFLPVVWDLNESFGVFSQTGSIQLNGTTAKQRMTHLLHENDSDYPLVQKLLNTPRFKRMYLAHMKTIVLESFDNGSYLETATALQDLIAESVQADDNKFYSYNNFLSNLNSDVSGGGGGPGGGNSAPGISNLMDARSDYLLGLDDFTAIEPVVSDISLSNSAPTLQEVVTVTTEVSNASEVILNYRSNSLVGPFAQVQMYDDGTHGDEIADDGFYTASISMNSLVMDYYIYAENTEAGKFSPQRAAHEFYQIHVANSPATEGVVINEFMASNDATVEDQDGDYDDWIELYNNSSNSIDLSGYFLSDDADDLAQWSFPEGTTIGSGEYLIIWADKDEDQEGLHADFKLSASGEAVILSSAVDTSIVDIVVFPEQITDVSYARFPNGTGDFDFLLPSFDKENIELFSSSNDQTRIESDLSFFPNPAYSHLYFSVKDDSNLDVEISIYDMKGGIVWSGKLLDTNVIDISTWRTGMYFVVTEGQTRKLMVY